MNNLLSEKDISNLFSPQTPHDELVSIAIRAVKGGDAGAADLAFKTLHDRGCNLDPVLMLYKGRLLSLKGDFDNFIEFSDTYSSLIKRETSIADPLAPWYWRQGIAYAILNQKNNSENAFARMRNETNSSMHEKAHYFQCYGAVQLAFRNRHDKAQELLSDSILMYIDEASSDEPYYSSFDNFRCIVVNLIMQSIYDLQSGKTHIAYRKMLYCREWVAQYNFSRNATGISEIAKLFQDGDFEWVFDFVFNSCEALVSISQGSIDNEIMFQVSNEELRYQSLHAKTIGSALKAFRSDYLIMNSYPVERFRKYYMIHLETLAMKNKKVFIVYGRNIQAYKEFVSFIVSLGLEPIDWNEGIRLTERPSPYLGEIIEAGMKEARMIIVLLTPDEEVRLRDSYCKKDSDKEIRYQSRANVIFETGYALAKYPNQTIIVKMGNPSTWSDIEGLYPTRISNDICDRNALVNRLRNAGCPIDISSSDLWKTQGNLDVS